MSVSVSKNGSKLFTPSEVDDLLAETMQNSLDILKKQWTTSIEGKGSKCPVCDRYGKIYGYYFTEGLALTLLRLYEVQIKAYEHGNVEGWIYIQGLRDLQVFKAIFKTHGWHKLCYWGFCEYKSGGNWRITKKGISYLRGDISAAKRVWVYDGNVLKESVEQSFYKDSIGVEFDYDELMADAYSYWESNN